MFILDFAGDNTSTGKHWKNSAAWNVDKRRYAKNLRICVKNANSKHTWKLSDIDPQWEIEVIDERFERIRDCKSQADGKNADDIVWRKMAAAHVHEHAHMAAAVFLAL